MHGRILIWTIGLLVALSHGCTHAQSVAPRVERRANTDFEVFDYHLWHPADQYGGVLDPEVRHGGVHSWRMDLDAYPYAVFVSSMLPVEPDADYRLGVWILTEDVRPADAVRLRVQPFADGKPGPWVAVDGVADPVRTGGSHGWHRFVVPVPASALPPGTDELAVYLRAEAGAEGTVWFDDLALEPVASARSVQPVLSARSAPAAPRTSVRRSREPAPPFLTPAGRGLSLRTDADANLFYGPRPARVRIQADPSAGRRVEWTVTDYDGAVVDRGERDVSSREVVVEIPDYGYFEVVARLYRGARIVGSARTSLAHLAWSAPPETSADFPLGAWVQQDDLLDDFGARWTRIGSGWAYLEPEPGRPNEALWRAQDAQIARYQREGRRIVYLFHRVPGWAGSHPEVVGAGYWDDFRAFVRKTVARYADAVDVWEAINEPYMPELYTGTPDDIVRQHRIVYEEVRRHDPSGVVVGPSASPADPRLFDQFADLMARGLGDVVDGVSLHTYGGLEAGGFLDRLAAVRAVLRRHGHGEKPLYITEHGLSVPDRLPLERVQARTLARTLLLARQGGVRALVWHMMSWPDGEPARERNYAVVRATPGGGARAPRPAFVAAATAAEVLGTARFAGLVEGLGETVGAQRYADGRRTVYALWEWGRPERTVTLDVGALEVTVVDVVGRRERRAAPGGRLTLTLTPDPVYVVVEE